MNQDNDKSRIGGEDVQKRMPTKEKEQKNGYFNYPLAFILCLSVTIVTLCIVGALMLSVETDPVSTFVWATVIYVFAVASIVSAIGFFGRSVARHETILHRFDKMLDSMVFPYIITNKNGIIVKHNSAARSLFEKRTFSFMPNISEVLPFLTPEIIKASVRERVELQQKTGEVEGETRYIIAQSTETVIGDAKKTADPTKGAYYLTTLVDITDEKNRLVTVAKRLENETVAVGRVEIDDLKAFSLSSGISEKEASDKVRDILTDWTLHQKGLIYEPETRKFIIMIPLDSLTACIKEKFPLLDTIREAVSTKEDELTISMGISATGETLSERLRNADVAFEQRKGGNKAIINTAGELTFFGRDRRRQGTQGGAEYRRIGHTLRRLINESGNVLIMGHRLPDYDSIGSAIGVAKLAAELRKDWHIVIDDQTDENFACLTEDIRARAEYEGAFIGEAEALKMARSNTLLIVTDVNAATKMESSELYRVVREVTGGKTVIIDHHEKNGDTAPSDFEYIDASASSASEIISGVLELSLLRSKLTSEEATMLLAGIMLDTKNFTQYAGTKTYAAAEYLSRASGSAEKAKRFFEADFETFSAEYTLGSSLTLLSSGRIAICSGTGPSDETKAKIVIGRVADRLLQMKGVLASVVIAENNGRINASARSNNNVVNCTELLAGLGGGNFNNAGASSSEMSPSEFLSIVKDNINRFMNEQLDGGSSEKTED